MGKTATASIVDDLAEVLKRAKAAGLAADPGADADGGTCNFDTPAFRIARAREATILEAAKLAGVDVCSFKWRGNSTWFWLQDSTLGQGNRRTKMMGAAQAVLRECSEANTIPGFEACGYYAMD